ncbi:MAG: PP2C family protein-serine/threonine phosphatase [Acidobacteria bacterium]|nr:PP2C family protein-serine/threonine phosphatase [Acidobacteriota bacterium]
MNLLGRRSLSSVLGAVINVLLLGACSVGLFQLGLLATTAIAPADRNFTASVPVAFTIAPSAYQLTARRDPRARADVEGAIRGTVRLARASKSMAVVSLLVLLPLTTVIIAVLYRLRRVLRGLRQGRPFLAENATDLRFIGLMVIGGQIAWAGLQYLGMRFGVDELTSAQLVFQAPFPLNVPIIVSGLVLVVVAEVFREGNRMRSDFESAREIQGTLVAEASCRTANVAIESRMRPARDVGGDYYDIIDLGEGRIAVVVADVAGKGLPAALLMTLLRGSLRSLILAGLRDRALIEALNRHLVANTPSNRLVTCFYAEIDSRRGTFRYLNAGHNPPFLVNGAAMHTLGPTGIVLGVMDDMPFEAVEVDVSAGARLLVYTDGLPEATNVAGEELGMERLAAIVAENVAGPPAAVVDATLARVVAFAGRAPQHDDMTIMLVAIDPAA